MPVSKVATTAPTRVKIILRNAERIPEELLPAIQKGLKGGFEIAPDRFIHPPRTMKLDLRRNPRFYRDGSDGLGIDFLVYDKKWKSYCSNSSSMPHFTEPLTPENIVKAIKAQFEDSYGPKAVEMFKNVGAAMRKALGKGV